MASMSRLPLSAYLSQALVAFLIEFDNTFEARTPHRTANFGGLSDTPFLVSHAMWAQILQYVPDRGIAPADLLKATGMSQKSLTGWVTRLSQWWGYLQVDKKLIRPTQGGLAALHTWRPLTAEIESRWETRFGAAVVQTLRSELLNVSSRISSTPGALPILGYGLICHPEGNPADGPNLDLPTLLSKLLLACAVQFEGEGELSLAISANILRLLTPEGVPLRDLSSRSGISREAVAMALGFLEKEAIAIAQPESPGSRHRILVPTEKGLKEQKRYGSNLAAWQSPFGEGIIAALAPIVLSPQLFEGLVAPKGCWRARQTLPETLPHFPMILHRGGFPDGS